ncbi:MAG: phytanoyl-CoA dioxygenase family protein [Candidatus Obscuribacterales bacterium]|nr:phytanoyl-CoA dioxygenase family protein [Candidatus Obscuribacterales bacterium]
MIINDRVRELVERIEAATALGPALDADISELVLQLTIACARPEAVALYAEYPSLPGNLSAYPLDADGFALGFDPVLEEEAFRACWRQHGIVVGKNLVAAEPCERAVARIAELVLSASEGRCDLNKPETWASMPADSSSVSLLSRGFFELYHDAALAALRQSVRVYLHFVLLWGRANLWTSFDRLGVKLPGHCESKALPLHVDQNPNVHPSFRTVQGVLALRDCPVERGTFVGVPGSKVHFAKYGPMAQNAGEYVELDTGAAVAAELTAHKQALPLRRGHLVSWDSRTTHANSENVSSETRYVAYIACGPAREDDAGLVQARRDAFASGIGSNNRNALMHASKPPRFTNPALLAGLREPEKLTLMGRLLYGQSNYPQI